MIRLLVSATFSLTATFAQSPPVQSEGPRFEVVAIKSIPAPTPGDGTPYGLNVNGARVQGVYQLFGILTRAFRLASHQLDAPDFTRGEFFEIQATLPHGSTPEQVPGMLQNMLIDRFKLSYHREMREYQVNVPTVGKGGMKLPRLLDGTQTPSTYSRLADGTMRVTQTGNVSSWFPVMNSFGGLQMVDETGLDGIYIWVRDQAPATSGMSYQETVQDSFEAIIEAARLKLEARKVPKETIVIDHLEKKPTEN